MNAPTHLVIPAAGLGTRMRPVSRSVPKELLPLDGRPPLQFAIEEGLSIGLRDIAIIISRKKELLRRYVEDDAFRKENYPDRAPEMAQELRRARITFFYQDRPLGEAHAIALARDWVAEASFAVVYPDNIYLPAPGALREIRHVFESHGADTSGLTQIDPNITAEESSMASMELYRIEERVYEIRRILEKNAVPSQVQGTTGLRGTGFMMTGPHFFDYVDRAWKGRSGPELHDRHVRSLMIGERPCLACALSGRVYDVGNPWGYAQCRAVLEKTERSKP